MDPTLIGYLAISGVTMGALYALVALGIVVVYKSTGIVNFAHGELFMVGGFLAYTFHVMFGQPYLVSLVLAVAATFVIGILTDRIAFRPLMKSTIVSVVLATVGFSFIIKGAARFIWGGKGDYIPFPPLMPPNPWLIGSLV
ncbi:MAG: branched-chain amino acid ABC transporter permease, partial [Alphaproteobacteria bacterium]|nr:branched-chain amino acid ABC transporter permease [Alphaproteobacteria bacterium]